MAAKGPRKPRPVSFGLMYDRRRNQSLALEDQARRLAAAIGVSYSENLLSLSARRLSGEEFDDLVAGLKVAKQEAAEQTSGEAGEDEQVNPVHMASRGATPDDSSGEAGRELERYLRSLEIAEGRR
ncbi:MAG: hypothetical protein M1389_04165 [Chloroflexi bacterium]|nr:hypothetical protein [Chloroflexota bacterium]MDA8216114.1 hypothetical protein [Dehalococcoidales bacterium]